MSDDPLDHRLRALRQGMVAYAVLQVVLVITALAAGDRALAGVVAMFGVATGIAVWDAVRSRIELARYRRAFGELPDGKDRP